MTAANSGLSCVGRVARVSRRNPPPRRLLADYATLIRPTISAKLRLARVWNIAHSERAAASAGAPRSENKVFEKLEQAVERKLDGSREEKEEKRALSEVVGDCATDLVLHVVGKIGLDQSVERIRQRQQLDIDPAEPVEPIGVQIDIDRINDEDRHHEQHDLAQEQPDE